MAKKEAAKEEEDKTASETPPEGAAAEGGEGAPKKEPFPFLAFLPVKLRLPALIGAPVLLILIIVLGLVLGGVFSKKPEKGKDGEHAEGAMVEEGSGEGHEGEKEGKEEEKPTYYNLPDLVVNLESRGRKGGLMKLAVTLELGSPEDLKAVEDKMPRVMDEFQVFLREVRVEDLRGSAGIYRIRQELLARAKPAVAPIKVKDVLFKELLVQ